MHIKITGNKITLILCFAVILSHSNAYAERTCPAGWEIYYSSGIFTSSTPLDESYTPGCRHAILDPSNPPPCPVGTILHSDDTSFSGTRYCKWSKAATKPSVPITYKSKNKLTSDLGISASSPLYSTGLAMEGTCSALQRKKDTVGLNAGEQALLQNCLNLLNENSTTAKIEGLQQISPIALRSQQTTVKQAGSFNLGSITSRLLALRQSSDEAQKDMALQTFPQAPGELLQKDTAQKHPFLPETGGAAGDMDGEENWGLFVNATGSRGERDQSEMVEGFEYDGFNITVGGDYLFASGTVFGGAIGFGSTSSELNNHSGQLDSDILMFSLYGLHDFERFYLDGVLGFGFGDYQNDRYQDFTVSGVNLNQTLNGDTDGNILFASFGGGKVFTFSNFDFDLSGRLNYLRATIDGYQESTDSPLGTGLALELDDQEITSITSDIGVRASYPFSFSFGVMQPEVSFNYLHEFDDDGDDIRARFINDPFSKGFIQTDAQPGKNLTTIFSVPSEKRDTDYANLGFGLNVVLPYGQSIMLNASTMLLYDDYSHWNYTIGYRKNF